MRLLSFYLFTYSAHYKAYNFEMGSWAFGFGGTDEKFYGWMEETNYKRLFKIRISKSNYFTIYKGS